MAVWQRHLAVFAFAGTLNIRLEVQKWLGASTGPALASPEFLLGHPLAVDTLRALLVLSCKTCSRPLQLWTWPRNYRKLCSVLKLTTSLELDEVTLY